MPADNRKNIRNQARVIDAGLIKNLDSPEADAIVRIQSNIEFSSPDKPIKTIAVTSSQEAEGKTTLACNLALVYAEKGVRAVLVDVDLRKPEDHKLFGLPNKVGVVEFVKGDTDELDDIVHHTDSGLDVITAGSPTPFSGRILASKRMTLLLDKLKAEYDYVILDTPPVLVVSDAYFLGHEVDGYLFVCAQHVSKKKDVQAAIETLQEKNLNIIGIVITMITSDEEKVHGGYGYGYGYGYGKGHYGYGSYEKDHDADNSGED